jgi:DNA-binding SARP family transcriptional activator
MLAIAVLGPTELRRDGERIPVPSGKTTEVLIRLALDAGAVVRADRLIEDLWGAEADATERNTLQAKVSLLRRALGDATVLSGGRAGYTLGVDPSAVDALEVLRVADATKALLEAGEARSALAQSLRALTLFRGEILCDAGDRDWLIPHRVRLEEVRLGLVEVKLAARMELGAAGEVIGELGALVVLHPLRERLWTLLITALYRDGRQADALGATAGFVTNSPPNSASTRALSCKPWSNGFCSATAHSTLRALTLRDTRAASPNLPRRWAICRHCHRGSSGEVPTCSSSPNC